MENDDETLSRVMEKAVAEPVADDGFTTEAIRRMHGRRRRAPFPRRAVFIAALAAACCLFALLPAWDETTAFAHLLQEKTAGIDGSAPIPAAVLALTAALSAVVFLLNRLESSR